MNAIENPTFDQKQVDVEQVVSFFQQLPVEFKKAVERVIQAAPELAEEAEIESAATQDNGSEFLSSEEVSYYLNLPDHAAR